MVAKETGVTFPTGPCVMAACDSKYFLEHAPSLIKSLDNINKDCHIHIANPTGEVFTMLKEIKSRVSINLTYTYNTATIENVEPRTYYACLRFHIAPMILKHAKQLLIVDIDAVFVNDFTYPALPVGYFPRESLPGTVGWEAEGTKVLASAVYYNEDGIDIAMNVARMIDALPQHWFVDQVALYKVISAVDKNRVYSFDTHFLDSDQFSDDSIIWNAKGDRKHNNMTYLNKKQELVQCLQL